MNTLTVVNDARAGLGNRMRFTLSGMEIARVEGREFQYYWPTSELFEPALSDLWEFNAKELDSRPVGDARSAAHLDLASYRDEDHWLVKGSSAFVSSGSGQRPWGEVLADLTPHESIQTEINKWKGRLPKSYIGLQLRVHENAHSKTKEKSPVQWYEDKISEALALNPDQAFFISCDDPEVQRNLSKKYPAVVGLTDKGAYNSSEAVVASIVDLYLLASASIVYSAFWSSFPIMAFELSRRQTPFINSVRQLK